MLMVFKSRVGEKRLYLLLYSIAFRTLLLSYYNLLLLRG